MPKRLLHRRGTETGHATFTGGQGEFTYDTTNKRIVAHDGLTAGGVPHAKLDETLQVSNNLSDLGDDSEARSNLSVLSKLESYASLLIRGQAPSLAFHGNANSQRVYSTLDYSIGEEEFTMRLIARIPTSVSAVMSMGVISSSNSAVAANGFAVLLTTSGALEVRLYGASTSDYSYAQVSGFVTAYGGKTVEVHVARLVGGSVAVYVNGEAVTVGATNAVGTGPGWGGSITSTYFILGNGVTSTAAYRGEMFAATLFNYAVSASQSSTLALQGIPVADQWAPDTELISATADRDFSGANNWANSSFSSFDAATGDMSITASAASQKASLPDAAISGLIEGRRYKITCEVSGLSGTTFYFYAAHLGVTVGTVSADGKFTGNFVNDSDSSGDIEIYSKGSGSVNIDNFSFKQAGAVFDMDIREASEHFIPDASTNKMDCFKNGGTTGSWIRRRKRTGCFARGFTNTNGNQQLTGNRMLPTRHLINFIVIYSSDINTTAVDIGSSSGGSDIASAVSISPGLNVVTLASRVSTSGNLWINANGTDEIETIVNFDNVD